jgi:hypothetical protein
MYRLANASLYLMLQVGAIAPGRAAENLPW